MIGGYKRPSIRRSGCTQLGERRSLNATKPSTASAPLYAGLHADPVEQAHVVVQTRLDHRARAGRGATAVAEYFPCRREQFVVRDDPRDHAPVHGLVSGQDSTGEHQVARADGPDDAGQHLAVVRVGDAPVQLGHAKRRPVAHDGHVAAHGDLQPAALAQPVDRRHHGLDRLAQRFERGDVHRQRTEVHPVVHAVAAAEVAARREHVTATRDQQPRQVRVGIDQADCVSDAEVHGRGHGVARLGAVQRAHPEGALPGEPQERGAQPVAFRRAGGGLGRHASPILSWSR